MASLCGFRAAVALSKKGWKYAEHRSMTGELVCGNPKMIDPETGDEHTVEEAKKIQERREDRGGE